MRTERAAREHLRHELVSGVEGEQILAEHRAQALCTLCAVAHRVGQGVERASGNAAAKQARQVCRSASPNRLSTRPTIGPAPHSACGPFNVMCTAWTVASGLSLSTPASSASTMYMP